MTDEERSPHDPLSIPASRPLRELVCESALSRDRGAASRRFSVHGEHLNAWCTTTGNPFVGGCLLLPNGPDEPGPEITFGAIEHQHLGAITLLLASAAEPPHANILAWESRATTVDGRVLAEQRVLMGAGDRKPLTLHLPGVDGPLRVTVSVAFERFDGTRTFGSVRMRYMVAYRDSELMRLFNKTGTDKGSEVYWGDGVPHLYALAYEPILRGRRDDDLNLLEIGLDTASEHTGSPVDAPSLRAWREFLPRATLYGFDIHDFSFLSLRDTHTFQGDQSSPTDLERFRATLAGRRLDLVIDDGSHVPSHQQIALAHLFDSVAPGGTYVIEDLFWQPGDESPTTADVLRRYLESGRIESPFIAPDRARRLEDEIDEVLIVRPNDSELAIISRTAT